MLGLRDKIIFLAARGEVYAPLALVFLFAGADIVVGAKVVFMVIWLGAATSKLNKHFPFVISTMLANNPFIPSGFAQAVDVQATIQMTCGPARWRVSSPTSPPRSKGWCRWCCSSHTAAGQRPSPRS